MAWAYTQEVIWSSAAAWDLVPGGSAWAVPVDFERFDLEAIMNWLGDRYATGPEPWLEAQALIFDLMTEKIETLAEARVRLPWKDSHTLARALLDLRERNGRRDAVTDPSEDE